MGPILIDESGISQDLTTLINKPFKTFSLRDAVIATLKYVLAYTDTPDTTALSSLIQERVLSNENKYGIALSMLLDLPVTATILFDIVHENRLCLSPEIDTILDLGTGSGILGFAGLLHLKRHGIRGNVVGVDNQPQIAHMTNNFYEKLGIGKVLQADSAQENVIERLGIAPQKISWIMNENLGQPGKPVHTEPFFDNLWRLRRCSIDLQKTHLFPHGITIENYGQNRLPTFLSVDNNFGGVLEGSVFKHPRIIWKRLKSTSNRDYNKVGGTQKGYYGFSARKFFNPQILKRLPSRWIDYSED